MQTSPTRMLLFPPEGRSLARVPQYSASNESGPCTEAGYSSALNVIYFYSCLLPYIPVLSQINARIPATQQSITQLSARRHDTTVHSFWTQLPSRRTLILHSYKMKTKYTSGYLLRATLVRRTNPQLVSTTKLVAAVILSYRNSRATVRLSLLLHAEV
jgi:hypothetical protein